jgi:hypothetical protein
MTALTVLATLLFAANGSAMAEKYSSCRATLAIHQFTECPGKSQPCEAQKLKLGDLIVNLSISGRDLAAGEAVFKSVDGALAESGFDCALTEENSDVNDMQCVMQEAVNEQLGRLSLSFNSSESPYYVVVFHEFGNAPIGSFSTEEDCD